MNFIQIVKGSGSGYRPKFYGCALIDNNISEIKDIFQDLIDDYSLYSSPYIDQVNSLYEENRSTYYHISVKIKSNIEEQFKNDLIKFSKRINSLGYDIEIYIGIRTLSFGTPYDYDDIKEGTFFMIAIGFKNK